MSHQPVAVTVTMMMDCSSGAGASLQELQGFIPGCFQATCIQSSLNLHSWLCIGRPPLHLPFSMWAEGVPLLRMLAWAHLIRAGSQAGLTHTHIVQGGLLSATPGGVESSDKGRLKVLPLVAILCCRFPWCNGFLQQLLRLQHSIEAAGVSEAMHFALFHLPPLLTTPGERALSSSSSINYAASEMLRGRTPTPRGSVRRPSSCSSSCSTLPTWRGLGPGPKQRGKSQVPTTGSQRRSKSRTSPGCIRTRQHVPAQLPICSSSLLGPSGDISHLQASLLLLFFSLLYPPTWRGLGPGPKQRGPDYQARREPRRRSKSRTSPGCIRTRQHVPAQLPICSSSLLGPVVTYRTYCAAGSLRKGLENTRGSEPVNALAPNSATRL